MTEEKQDSTTTVTDKGMAVGRQRARQRQQRQQRNLRPRRKHHSVKARVTAAAAVVTAGVALCASSSSPSLSASPLHWEDEDTTTRQTTSSWSSSSRWFGVTVAAAESTSSQSRNIFVRGSISKEEELPVWNPDLKEIMKAFRGTSFGEVVPPGKRRRDLQEFGCESLIQQWKNRHIQAMGDDLYGQLTELSIDSMAFFFRRFVWLRRHQFSLDIQNASEYFGEGLTEELMQRHATSQEFWKRASDPSYDDVNDDHELDNSTAFLEAEEPVWVGDDAAMGSDGQNETTATNSSSSSLQSSRIFPTQSGDLPRVDLDDVVLLGMHGRDLMDVESNLIPTLDLMFKFKSSTQRNEYVHKTLSVIERLPDTYDNPLLTMNALATNYQSSRDFAFAVKPTIVIGDGLLEYLQDLNLAQDGPDFIHAHEMAHHVLNQLGPTTSQTTTPTESTSDATSTDSSSNNNNNTNLTKDVNSDLQTTSGSASILREELTADALGAYFLAHTSVDAMSLERILELEDVAWSIGDCLTQREDHHGTPQQRQCVANWAVTSFVLEPIDNQQGSSGDVEGSGDSTPAPELHHPQTLVQLLDASWDYFLALHPTVCIAEIPTHVTLPPTATPTTAQPTTAEPTSKLTAWPTAELISAPPTTAQPTTPRPTSALTRAPTLARTLPPMITGPEPSVSPTTTTVPTPLLRPTFDGTNSVTEEEDSSDSSNSNHHFALLTLAIIFGLALGLGILVLPLIVRYSFRTERDKKSRNNDSDNYHHLYRRGGISRAPSVSTMRSDAVWRTQS